MEYFTVIPEGQAIVVTRGVYRQVPVYARGEFRAILNGDKIRAAASAGDMLTIQAADASRAVRITSPGNDCAEAVIMSIPAMASELADE